MATSSLCSFKVGEVCNFGISSVLILKITKELGFNRYSIIDLDTGEQKVYFEDGNMEFNEKKTKHWNLIVMKCLPRKDLKGKVKKFWQK